MPINDPVLKREYQRNWMRKRRDQYFSDKICTDCGSTERLELDHIDPDQKIDHRIFSWRQDRREAELLKCQVLCYVCHKKKTIHAATKHDRPHGDNKTYNSGCRCRPCKDAMAARWRAYRASKKLAPVAQW